MDRLEEIRARELAATPEPWIYEVDDEGSSMGWVSQDRSPELPPVGLFQVLGDSWQQADNADFAAHARSDIPYLLTELQALREENERLRKSRRHTQDWYARHYGKLEDWARKVLPEPHRTQFFSCIANGLYDAVKDIGKPYMRKGAGMVTPGGYVHFDTAQEQILHDQGDRAESAEQREAALLAKLERYGRHDTDCPCIFTAELCTCGLAAALSPTPNET